MISSAYFALPSEPFLTPSAKAAVQFDDSDDHHPMLDAMPASIALLNGDGVVVRLNQAWRRLGAEIEDGRIRLSEGSSFVAAWEAADDPHGSARRVVLGIRLVIAGYKREFSLVHPCASGAQNRWFELTVRPITVGGAAGALVMLIDVTRDRVQQEMLLRALRASRRAVEAKTSTFAGINHDMRAPLNAILGFSSLLKSGHAGLLTDKQQEYVCLVHEAGKHLLEVADAMLSLARLEADYREMHDSEVALPAVVRSSLDIVREAARGQGQVLSAEIDPGTPTLMADEGMLRRMLVNLLNNAVKYSGTDAIISVRTWGGSDGLTVSVRDNGPGIPAAKLEQVCQPYHRGDSSRAEGVGLGLALVRSMAEAHGGRFALSSIHRVGTTATLWFPPERLVLPDGGENLRALVPSGVFDDAELALVG